MKRLVKISALAALAVSLAFSTVACSDGDDDDSTTPASDAPSTVDAPDTPPAESNDDSDSNGSKTPADNSGSGEQVTKATAKTYSFTGTGVTLENLSGWDMESKDVIGSPIAKDGSSTVLASGATVYYKSSKAGTVRFRSAHAAKAELTADMVSAITALNFNGGLASGDFSADIDLATVDRYVKVSVDGAGTVAATVTFKGGKDTDGITADGKFKAALVDSNGKVLGTAEGELVGDTEATVSATVSAASDVYLVFSRNGAKKSSGSGTGGMDVTSIEVKPAE